MNYLSALCLRQMHLWLLGTFCGIALNCQYSIAVSTPENCSYYHFGLPGVHFYRQFFAPTTCYVDVTPMDTETLVYRSYLFSDQGLFMVFNSYGDGEPSKFTGARVFYLLPRGATPHAEKTEDGNLRINLASPASSLEIDGITARLKGLIKNNVPAKLLEKEEINPQNQGGVEIANYAGLLIDTGFSIGQDPKTDPNRQSLVIDHKGNSCKLKNKELFVYDNPNFEGLRFNDDQLKKYLHSACPAIDPGY